MYKNTSLRTSLLGGANTSTSSTKPLKLLKLFLCEGVISSCVVRSMKRWDVVVRHPSSSVVVIRRRRLPPPPQKIYYIPDYALVYYYYVFWEGGGKEVLHVQKYGIGVLFHPRPATSMNGKRTIKPTSSFSFFFWNLERFVIQLQCPIR